MKNNKRDTMMHPQTFWTRLMAEYAAWVLQSDDAGDILLIMNRYVPWNYETMVLSGMGIAVNTNHSKDEGNK